MQIPSNILELPTAERLNIMAQALRESAPRIGLHRGNYFDASFTSACALGTLALVPFNFDIDAFQEARTLAWGINRGTQDMAFKPFGFDGYEIFEYQGKRHDLLYLITTINDSDPYDDFEDGDTRLLVAHALEEIAASLED